MRNFYINVSKIKNANKVFSAGGSSGLRNGCILAVSVRVVMIFFISIFQNAGILSWLRCVKNEAAEKVFNKQFCNFIIKHKKINEMKLGAFSISLSVRDLETSKTFYEKLGFAVFAGDMAKNYLIMKNGNSLIGLFQGMFEQNILTFNPGWDENAQTLESFDDVRVIQRKLKDSGVALASEADENTTGPASLVVVDPDGNTILIDQHI